MPEPTAAEPAPPYDRDAIFHEDGPLEPGFMNEAIRTLMRTMPLDSTEPRGWAYRRMHSAMRALSALHPRDEIEVMLGVQALSAYHAAAACWRIGMNLRRPNGDSTRHITTAASAARTFDSLLKAMERRQAKPLSVPVGRPPSRAWPEPDPASAVLEWEERCRRGEDDPEPERRPEPALPVAWTQEDLAVADERRERERIEKENEGLDIANTEGILPGGGMIMPEDPTPQQAAYIGRRLGLMYKREYEADLRKGIKRIPKIRPIRPGDLIP
ncbi:MAG: hypothetical protein P4L90_05390 [Rhodopila sp.]|nr:hypothetical protein [Rhodopila sp.]